MLQWIPITLNLWVVHQRSSANHKTSVPTVRKVYRYSYTVDTLISPVSLMQISPFRLGKQTTFLQYVTEQHRVTSRKPSRYVIMVPPFSHVFVDRLIRKVLVSVVYQETLTERANRDLCTTDSVLTRPRHVCAINLGFMGPAPTRSATFQFKGYPLVLCRPQAHAIFNPSKLQPHPKWSPPFISISTTPNH